jgi:excinuclease ABC subunit A
MDKLPVLPPIRLTGVRQHNLKNISVEIPRKKLTVITGLSGSGKSSLAFDTLYAEGQRRYVESLSTYTRQFLQKMPKPDIDQVENVPPAIALEQRNTVQNSRSTVATQSEVADYLRLLFSKMGTLKCQTCGSQVTDLHLERIRDLSLTWSQGRSFAIASPLHLTAKNKRSITQTFMRDYFAILSEQGFRRVLWLKEAPEWLELDQLKEKLPPGLNGDALIQQKIFLLMDRFPARSMDDPDTRTRFDDSLEQALRFGQERVLVIDLTTLEHKTFETGFCCVSCGTMALKPSPHLFSFNSPLGACDECKGFGFNLQIDPKKVVPDWDLSIRDGAILPWTKPAYKHLGQEAVAFAREHQIAVNTPWRELSDKARARMWSGDTDFPGISGFFKELETKRYKFHVRIMIRRYQHQQLCLKCEGSRLKPEALWVKVREKNVAEAMQMTILDLYTWLKGLTLSTGEQQLVKDLFPQLKKRLEFLIRVGVHYLPLNRLTRTLSGGEFQRVNLATHLGNGLCGTLYVLDEPSIGLHASDTQALAELLNDLRDQGNTLVVVEHDPILIAQADHIIEMGPKAGKNGGEIVASGSAKDFKLDPTSRTGRLATLKESLQIRYQPRPSWERSISVTQCTHNNLKSVDFLLPLERFVVVTGVSGSGKTSLVHHTLAQALAAQFDGEPEGEAEEEGSDSGTFKKIEGLETLSGYVLLDQKPIGKNSRSNPATYLKVWDDVRKLLASTPLAQEHGFTPQFFSFNVDAGRCETCRGEGEISIDLHFMAAIQIQCEVCEGKRFKRAVLEVRYKGKNVDDILHMTVEEASAHFYEHSGIRSKLSILQSVGLGYITLGQSGPTLSGGESQRLKVAQALSEGGTYNHLFILDEPSTGLHSDDVAVLIDLLQGLVEKGASVLVVEHNLDIIANADWVIDLGPGAGAEGGEIIATGTPGEITLSKISKTGEMLKRFGVKAR